MAKKFKILVVGSFVMDLIVRTARVPNEGETVLDGIDFNIAAGGKGENQAVQAARLGADVTMVGRVGNDMFGSQLLKSAGDASINVDNVKVDKNFCSAVGNVTIEVKQEDKAQNRIIVVPGANMKITIDDVSFLKNTIDKYDMVMLQLEIPMEVNEAVASYAYEKGVPVMLNPAPSRKLSREFLSKLSYISPNEYEVADITGISIHKDKNGVNIDNVRKAAEALLDLGVKNVIITLGSSGAAFMNRENFLYQPCIDIVDVVDPTAAGDSFTGAFCCGICMGMDEKEALKFASYAATLTVSKMGAQSSIPFYDDVLKIMESNKQAEDSMIINKQEHDLEHFIDIAVSEVSGLSSKINIEFYRKAVEIILEAEKNGKRVHVTGIGKPGHVAGYVASLMSSTGTPAYELHCTEAVHGSSGQVLPGDVVIAISNSGGTSELKSTVTALKNNDASIIAVTGNPESWLAHNGDAFLYAGVKEEGGPLNRAPRASILSEIMVLQGLSLVLQSIKNITAEQYVKWHPGGALGKL